MTDQDKAVNANAGVAGAAAHGVAPTVGAWSHPLTQPITTGPGAAMGPGSGRATQASGAAAGQARKRTTSASGPRGAKYDAGSKGSKREADDVWD